MKRAELRGFERERRDRGEESGVIGWMMGLSGTGVWVRGALRGLGGGAGVDGFCCMGTVTRYRSTRVLDWGPRKV